MFGVNFEETKHVYTEKEETQGKYDKWLQISPAWKALCVPRFIVHIIKSL